MPKRKFRGTSKPRQFFDRKVRREGYSRTLSLGKIIPKNWRYVRITPIEKTQNAITLRIDKLLGNEINAHPKTPNKTNKPNTPTPRPTSSN